MACVIIFAACGFEKFLASEKGKELKSEYYLPGSVDELMKADKCDVRVYATDAAWYGVTYSEDKAGVKAALRALMDNGEYPHKLWK